VYFKEEVIMNDRRDFYDTKFELQQSPQTKDKKEKKDDKKGKEILNGKSKA
jgi:hypothetical protein